MAGTRCGAMNIPPPPMAIHPPRLGLIETPENREWARKNLLYAQWNQSRLLLMPLNETAHVLPWYSCTIRFRTWDSCEIQAEQVTVHLRAPLFIIVIGLGARRTERKKRSLDKLGQVFWSRRVHSLRALFFKCSSFVAACPSNHHWYYWAVRRTETSVRRISQIFAHPFSTAQHTGWSSRPEVALIQAK